MASFNIAALTRRLSSRQGSISAYDPFNQYGGSHQLADENSSLNDKHNQRRTCHDPDEHVIRFTVVRFPGGRNPAQWHNADDVHEISYRPVRPQVVRSASFSPNYGRQYSGPNIHMGLSSPYATLRAEQIFDLALATLNSYHTRGVPDGQKEAPVETDVPDMPPEPVSDTSPSPNFVVRLHSRHVLPFLHRPEEVSELLKKPPNRFLMRLLQQTFPQRLRSSDAIDDAHAFVNVSASAWQYTTLLAWLTTVPRPPLSESSEEGPYAVHHGGRGAIAAHDLEWAQRVKKCVMEHSEVIWVRLAGILGVPLELELRQDVSAGFADRSNGEFHQVARTDFMVTNYRPAEAGGLTFSAGPVHNRRHTVFAPTVDEDGARTLRPNTPISRALTPIPAHFQKSRALARANLEAGQGALTERNAQINAGKKSQQGAAGPQGDDVEETRTSEAVYGLQLTLASPVADVSALDDASNEAAGPDGNLGQKEPAHQRTSFRAPPSLARPQRGVDLRPTLQRDNWKRRSTFLCQDTISRSPPPPTSPHISVVNSVSRENRVMHVPHFPFACDILRSG